MINNSKDRSSLGIIIDFDVLNIKIFSLVSGNQLGCCDVIYGSTKNVNTLWHKGVYVRTY